MILMKSATNPSFDPFLVNDPIYLRRAVASDHGAWAALREESRAHLVAWEQDWAPDEITSSSFRRRLRYYERQARKGAGLPLFIFQRANKTLIGGVTLNNIRYGAAQSATLGYWVGRPHIRRGFGAMAVNAMLHHAFDAIGLHRIEAACQSKNTASRRLLLKLGFVLEGTARDYLKINGAWRDHDLYAITARDFGSYAAAD